MHVFTDKMCMGFSCIYPGSGDRPSGYETVGTLQAEAHMRTRRKCPAYTHPKPRRFPPHGGMLERRFALRKKTHGLSQKIQAMYFKIQGTYFKIYALYFSQL